VVSGGIKSFSAEELGNFTVTAKGIRFYFGPYAVASYAEGAFEVFVPWSDLGDHADTSLLE
jgi:hypothetical protein